MDGNSASRDSRITFPAGQRGTTMTNNTILNHKSACPSFNSNHHDLIHSCRVCNRQSMAEWMQSDCPTAARAGWKGHIPPHWDNTGGGPKICLKILNVAAPRRLNCQYQFRIRLIWGRSSQSCCPQLPPQPEGSPARLLKHRCSTGSGLRYLLGCCRRC